MFVLHYLDQLYGEYPTMDAAIQQVRENYEAWNSNPSLANVPGGFPFGLYSVYEEVKTDFENIITTNHRGTFPKSWRAEGENFID